MITISKPNMNDVEDIIDVHYQTWLDTYPNAEHGITVEDINQRFENRYSKENLLRKKEFFTVLKKGTTPLVARINNSVVGVSVIEENEEFAQLRSIYVLPKYQGMKIGKTLWQESLKVVDSTKNILVEVATYNNKAITFYTKLGFVDTGKRYQFVLSSGSVIPEMEMINRRT